MNSVVIGNSVSNIAHLLVLFIDLDKVTKYTWNGVLFRPNTYFCIVHSTLALMIMLQIQIYCHYIYHATVTSNSPICFPYIVFH
jgi:uncharacterized membrane protein